MSKKPKLGHEFQSKDIGEDGRERFFDVMITSRHDLIGKAKIKASSRHQFFKEDGAKVWTPQGRQILNEQYRENAILLKDYKKMMTDYSGDKDLASDLLFKAVSEGGLPEVKRQIEANKKKKREEAAAIIENGLKDSYYCKNCLPICAGYRAAAEEEKELSWWNKIKKWMKG